MEDAIERRDQGKEINPFKLRRFVKHLSTASIRAEEKSLKNKEVIEKIEKIRQLSLNKGSTKDEIESELTDFESSIREIIKDETLILDEQRKGTKQVNELRKMVEMLSQRIIELGRQYAAEMGEKDSKILELREALASAHITISESGGDRKKKIEMIEQKVRERAPAFEKESDDDLAIQLKMLEQKHAELKKTGKHPPSELERIKKIINAHKKKIAEMSNDY
jgi:uncharacterized protein YeaO (DUF488 family)